MTYTDLPQHRLRPKSSGPRPFTQPAAHTTPTVRGKAPVLNPAERAARARARKSNAIVTIWPSFRVPIYAGTELHQNPGIPAARFAAYDLPSRVGQWLYYPDGRVLPFPGSAADAAAKAHQKA